MNIHLVTLASTGLIVASGIGFSVGCGDSGSAGGAGGAASTTTGSSSTKTSTGSLPTTVVSSTGSLPTTVVTSTGSFPTTGSMSSGGGNDCANYCNIIETNCTGVSPQMAADKQYASNAECMTACAAFAPGLPGDVTGNTLACRIYHATVAGSAPQPGNADTHCAHAGKTPTAQCI